MRIGDLVRVRPSILNRSSDSILLNQVFLVVNIKSSIGVVDVIDPWIMRPRSFYAVDMVIVCRRSSNA